MRPHYLEFSGIGAYPGTVRINFDDLSTMGLYLIVGPTGSGKTTIFDAMTYALFGKTAGAREGMFVSDYEGREAPSVEFTFSHKGRRYTAHREPPPSKGKNAPTSNQWFREIDDTGADVRAVTGTKNVTAEVEGLLGLDAEQFMQIILLPQGKFKDFLMANSTDRRPLLQTIFGTHLYAEIAFKMKDASSALRDNASKAEASLMAERMAARRALEVLSTDIDTTSLPDPDEDLEGVITSLREVLSEWSATAKKVAAEYQQAVELASNAKIEATRYDAHVELQELVKTDSSLKKKVDAARVALDAHQRARPVADLATTLASHRSREEESHQALAKVHAEISKALSKIAAPIPQIATLKSAAPTATPSVLTKELEGAIRAVTDVQADLDDLEKQRKLLNGLRDDVKTIASDVTKKEAALKAAKASSTALRKSLKKAQGAAQELPRVENEIEKIRSLQEESDVDLAKQELKVATEKLTKASDRLAAAESRLTDARNNVVNHLAGDLAATLKSGLPCPVCGSTTHPVKAKKTAKVDVSQLESDRDKLHARRSDCEATFKAAADQLRKAQAAKAKLPSATAIAQIEKRFDSLSDLADSLEDLEDEEATLGETIEELTEEIGELKVQAKGLQTSATTAEKTIATLEEQTKSLGSATVVRLAHDALTTLRPTVKNFETTTNSADSARTAREAGETSLKKALATGNFGSEKEALAALLDEDDLDDLEALLEQSDERTTRIAELKGTVGKSPVAKTRPRVDDLQEALEIATARNTAAQENASRLQQTIGQLEDAKKKIARLGPQVSQQILESQQAADLAKIFGTGTGAGADRVLALEEWVQRTLFEEVCEVATQQLRILNKNRYTLTLDAEDAATKRKSGGLDLYVIDSESGKTRSVQTLSGGEQFLTSLALALALAEVVERHAGGMEISSLFIDEGFGGLDTEVLQDAIDALLKLRETGRTVGVITHVESMQQQLPIGIRIHKSKGGGSTLEVLAG